MKTKLELAMEDIKKLLCVSRPEWKVEIKHYDKEKTRPSALNIVDEHSLLMALTCERGASRLTQDLTVLKYRSGYGRGRTRRWRMNKDGQYNTTAIASFVIETMEAKWQSLVAAEEHKKQSAESAERLAKLLGSTWKIEGRSPVYATHRIRDDIDLTTWLPGEDGVFHINVKGKFKAKDIHAFVEQITKLLG